jgi:predicted DNA-binding transcriptional regulator YafY
MNTEKIVRASDISFNEGIMRLAAIHKKTVEFRYVKGPGAPVETRRLVPTNVRGEGEKLSFLGHDPDRDDNFRQFNLSKIKGSVAVIA